MLGGEHLEGEGEHLMEGESLMEGEGEGEGEHLEISCLLKGNK